LTTFVDTSALYAVLDRDDRWHGVAAAVWRELVESGEALVTHNYVLVEAFALVQRRLGMEAARALAQDVAPVLEAAFVDGRLHSHPFPEPLLPNPAFAPQQCRAIGPTRRGIPPRVVRRVSGAGSPGAVGY
jgi:predicted nucleic acid-binding protein